MFSSKNYLSKLILTFLLFVFIGFAMFFKPTLQYPTVELTTPENIQLSYLLTLIFLTLAAAGAASWFICYLIIRYEHLHAHFSHDPTDAGPQKFHANPTPRIGGLGLFGGLMAGAGVVLILRPASSFTDENFGYLLLAAVPAFMGDW